MIAVAVEEAWRGVGCISSGTREDSVEPGSPSGRSELEQLDAYLFNRRKSRSRGSYRVR
jgi:hypothetical protein